MGRIYTAVFTGTITAAGTDTDLVSIQPADDKPVKLRGLLLSQISEVGDAAEEGLRITIRRMPATFTVGSGGSAITPGPPDSADVAAGCTVRGNDTTVSTTSGTAVIVAEIGWNVRASPYELWFPDDRFAPKAKQGEGLVVRMETSLLDDMTGCFTFWLEEE
jgi:hypothetical protein